MIVGADTLDSSRDQSENVNEPQAIGYKMSVIKIVRPFIALAIPVTNWPWWAVLGQTGIASFLTFMTPMNLVLKLMLAAIIFDVFTGGCCRWSKVAVTQPPIGMVTILLKFGCYALASYLAKQPELIWDVWGKTWGVGEFLGLWYLVIELASIITNLDDLKIMRFPRSIKRLVSSIQSSIDDAEITPGAINILTSFSKKTEDGVQTVKEVVSTTVVTPAPLPPEKP